MTKYLFAAAALAAFGSVACGGNDCDDGADRTRAKRDECGLESAEATASDAECTEEDGARAQRAAECYEAAECPALQGTDIPGSVVLGECLAAIN